MPGNAGIQVTFPFSVAAAAPPAADLMRIQDSTLTYLRPMTFKERISFPITGFGPTAADYDIRIMDTKSRAGVTITGDQPLTRINIFSIDKVQSVEPYIAIELPPGSEQRWTDNPNQKTLPVFERPSRPAQRAVERIDADDALVLFIREKRANTGVAQRMFFAQLLQASSRLEACKYLAVSIGLGRHAILLDKKKPGLLGAWGGERRASLK